MEIVLMNVNDNALIPTRASKESAGLDLFYILVLMLILKLVR